MTVTDRGDAPAPPRSVGRAPRGRLALYMAVVSVLGLPLTVWAAYDAAVIGTSMPLAVVGLLVVALVVGELLPIADLPRRPQQRRDHHLHDLRPRAAARRAARPGRARPGAPLVLDDVRRRKHWSRPFFNVAQYALAFAAARGAYCLLTGSRPPAR